MKKQQLGLIFFVCFLVFTSVWSKSLKECVRDFTQCTKQTKSKLHFKCFRKFIACKDGAPRKDMAPRSTPHMTTGVSPAEILMGRSLRTRIPSGKENLQQPEMCEALRQGAENSSRGYADKKRKAKFFDIGVGDQALLEQRRGTSYQLTLTLDFM
ncbi:hypothetical protein ScPMuIL_008241 [Solemya velum]